MDFFKSIFDITKLPTKIFLVLSIVSGFFIFASKELIQLFRLDKLDEYSSYIGIIFLLSTSLVIVNFIIWLFNRINSWVIHLKRKKIFLKQLEMLDQYEKSVLREFFICGKNSLKMPIDDTVVSGLLHKNSCL